MSYIYAKPDDFPAYKSECNFRITTVCVDNRTAKVRRKLTRCPCYSSIGNDGLAQQSFKLERPTRDTSLPVQCVWRRKITGSTKQTRNTMDTLESDSDSDIYREYNFAFSNLRQTTNYNCSRKRATDSRSVSGSRTLDLQPEEAIGPCQTNVEISSV